jgi:hypothetical protein
MLVEPDWKLIDPKNCPASKECVERQIIKGKVRRRSVFLCDELTLEIRKSGK